MIDNSKLRFWQSYANIDIWQELIKVKAENIALSGELERTRKALELAKDTLHWYDDNYDSVVAQETINEITALKQKD